tara:strand:+ start:5599 stop:6510 length:912 start_codon:yes stop_codon:yes gene_type:complete
MSQEQEPIEEPVESFEDVMDEDSQDLSERVDEYIINKADELIGEDESDCPDGDCDDDVEGEEEEYYEVEEIDDAEVDELAERAAAVGLTDSDIEELGTVESLERTLRILEGRQNEPEEVEEMSLDLDNIPDEMRPVIEQMDAHYRERIEGLEAQLGQYNTFLDNQSEKEVVSEFDSFVSDLGPGFESLLGTGSTESLAGDSGEFARRVQVLEEMNILASGYEASNKAVPDEKTLFNRALNSLFAEQVVEAKNASTESTIAQRRGKFVSRPTQKHGKPQSPEAAARLSVRKYMEEAGIGIGGEE